MTTVALHWSCLTPGCDAHGTTTGTESGADQKHAATGHATVSHTAVWSEQEEGG